MRHGFHNDWIWYLIASIIYLTMLAGLLAGATWIVKAVWT